MVNYLIWQVHGLNGECLVEYAKQKLPNYQVFDEKRYFEQGLIRDI
jgi:predicted amidohydrolase